MPSPASYTPLESLFLFQSLLAHGVGADAFARISELLRNNALIKEADSYDPARLSPDALQHLFLLLFREELKADAEWTETTTATATATATANANTSDGSASPASRKRKPGSPPLPTLKDVYDNVERIPGLVDRLYARYRDHMVRQIREDEHRFETVQKEIQLLEKTESQRRARVAASQNGTPVLAPREVKPATPANGSSPSPMPTPGTAYPGIKRGPTPHTPVLPPKPPTPRVASPKVAPPTVAPPSHLPTGTPPVRPSPSPKPPNGAASVLQAPTGVPQTGPAPPRPLQPPSQPPKQALSPRPEVGILPKDSPAAQQTALTAGALKWEKPYQPPQATPTPPRQFQSPIPPNANIQPAPPQPPPPQQQHHPPQQQHQHQHQQQQSWYPQQPQYSQQAKGQPPYIPQSHVQHPPQIQPPQVQSQPAQQIHHPHHVPNAHARPPAGKPVLVPPQHVGHVAPPLQPAPSRPTGEASGVQAPQPRPPSTTPVVPPTTRPTQPPPTQAQQTHQAPQTPRPIASASPTPPAGATGHIAPPQPRWPQAYQHQSPQGQSPSASPAPLPSQKDKTYTSPYVAQPPRPAIPEHIIRQVVSTPGPKRPSIPPTQPHTPVSASSAVFFQGFGTRWASQSTPSTPKSLTVESQSPAFEPVSPPQRAAALPGSTPKPLARKNAPKPAHNIETPAPALKLARGRPPRSNQKGRGLSTTPSVSGTRRSQSVTSNADELSLDHADLANVIKNEDVTPRPVEETGDTTADESVPSRPQIATPSSMSRGFKRKRHDSLAEAPPPTTHVLWTRGFTKVSSSALDQISSHRDANMFATALREKDAPGYRQVVLQPQDITSIRSAIKHGNKAALQAASLLPGGDPGTANVWLPTSGELVPPKGIINSAQLERELVHMFCNAIMYNPDPDRGPGPGFMKRSQDEEEEVVGYRLDENGVVKNTRSMFVEVEKLLGDLRSAEKERSAPPPSAARPASVATPADDTGAEDEDELAGDDVGPSTVKRRRIGTRG